MDLSHATALVTGANRGFGRALADELADRGATVYAGARNPASVAERDGVTALALDITDPDSIAAAARRAGDVTLLVNNAGISTRTPLLEGDLGNVQRELDTHVFGTLRMVRAFAPVIESNGGGAILNVLSVLSWFSLPGNAAYCAAKSAEWSMTNAVRLQLAPRGVHVGALHVGYMDTDLTAGLDVDKADPAEIAAITADGIAADQWEIVSDEISRTVQAGLAGGVSALYPELAGAAA